MNSIDSFIQNYLHLNTVPSRIEIFYVFTTFFDLSFHFFLVSVLVAVLIYLFRGINYSFLFLGALFFGGVLVYFLKIFFGIPRPVYGLVETIGSSFPSGHATIATIFFIMLMYVFDDRLKSPSRITLNSFSVIAIFSVAFSRVYLGVHWVSDVFWGIIIGSIISYISIKIFKSVIKA